MSWTTTEPLRSWSALLKPKPKQRSDTPQTLPITPLTPRNDDETLPAWPSRSSGSGFMGIPHVRSDGPPSYAHAVSWSEPTSYRFVQESAFSMSLVTQGEPSNTAYNISVGVNVWMPSEHITLVRRHANPEGPALARLEMGISSASATVTVGDQTMLLSGLMSGIHSSSSYLMNDGRVVKWKLRATAWEASLDNLPLATFSPNSRSLILQPRAHPDFDDIVISVLILMREHLTPKSTRVGDAAGLFNYHPFSTSE
ncbi:hypothetical protein BDM02DRAFT_1536491 [Thelephora ganbajun]|uniref:Uncharacterized protein n=1 Tax=Thelephora ganbajun TaxID=370292 RepID=A0ACB6ZJR7_THEGA|nr:hypothetical protein BDM02DRAFT_1536491 [Thelephora ganbajun]